MTQTRRDRLISAAAKLLDRGGPAGVTLREVGRAAGVSHNAPYKHFANKDELLAAVAGRELRRQTDVTVSNPGGVLTEPTPQSLMIRYVRWAKRYRERFKLTFGRWVRDDQNLRLEATRARSILVAAVKTAQAAGDLPLGEPERLAALLWALAHGAADLALSGHLSTKGKAHAEAEDLVSDLFRHLKSSALLRRPGNSGFLPSPGTGESKA
jgi:AcrR family transcriptional regulator